MLNPFFKEIWGENPLTFYFSFKGTFNQCFRELDRHSGFLAVVRSGFSHSFLRDSCRFAKKMPGYKL